MTTLTQIENPKFGPTLEEPRHFSPSGLDYRLLDPDALDAVERLQDRGYEAYLVGGCIRDMLLGNSPKDFDVATNATPEEVRGLFRRSRIVGRRFKIVHVRFGPEVIEVTTFRGSHHNHSSEASSEVSGEVSSETGSEVSSKVSNAASHVSKEGMLLRDNVYGNLRDDALRRDFTVNALYYSVDGFTVTDFTRGLPDLQAMVGRWR